MKFEDFLDSLMYFLKNQFVFYFKFKPTIPKSVLNTYKKQKKLILKEKIITNNHGYYDKYMPLDTRDNTNPNYQERMYVNHYRLWHYLGDRCLKETDLFNPEFPNFKDLYFKHFNLKSLLNTNYYPKNSCFLCELYSMDDCNSCKKIWESFPYRPHTQHCLASYYGLLLNDYNNKQKALICYTIANLVIPFIDLQFYKNHILADTSEKNIEIAYNENNRKNGIFEPNI